MAQMAVLTFGKYKGRAVEDILRSHAGYLLWAHNNVSFFELSSKNLAIVKNQVTLEAVAEMESHYFTSPGLVIRRSRGSFGKSYSRQPADYNFDDPMTSENLHGW